MKRTRKNGKSCWKLVRATTATLFVAFCLIFSYACGPGYNPVLYPSYDVLNPGEAVLKNPVGWVVVKGNSVSSAQLYDDVVPEDGVYHIVNSAFLQNYYELRAEIKELRNRLRELEK